MTNPKEHLLRQLWAFSHLFFLISSLSWIKDLIQDPILNLLPLILFISANLVIWSPNKCFFNLMIVSQICYAISSLPELQNHRYVAMFVNISLLLSARDSIFFNPNTIWTIARIGLITYFLAAFHKLNYDFFDPAVSCGMQFLAHVKSIFPIFYFSPSLIIYLTVFIELLLAILLVSKKTWKLAAVIGIIFHLGLSFDYYKMFINFTGVMSGVLSVVAINSYPKNIFVNDRNLRVISIVLSLSLVLTSFEIMSPSMYLFLIHSILIIWCFGIVFLISRSDSRFLINPNLLGGLIIFIFLLNCISPYLGIKNRGALSMYSNLQISPTFSNHIIFKRSLDLLGFNGASPSGILGKVFPFNPSGPEERNKCVW